MINAACNLQFKSIGSQQNTRLCLALNTPSCESRPQKMLLTASACLLINRLLVGVAFFGLRALSCQSLFDRFSSALPSHLFGSSKTQQIMARYKMSAESFQVESASSSHTFEQQSFQFSLFSEIKTCLQLAITPRHAFFVDDLIHVYAYDLMNGTQWLVFKKLNNDRSKHNLAVD